MFKFIIFYGLTIGPWLIFIPFQDVNVNVYIFFLNHSTSRNISIFSVVLHLYNLVKYLIDKIYH